MKLKSLKKQLKTPNVDWQAFAERARLKPEEVNANRIRQALKKRNPSIPFNVIKDVIQSGRNCGHCQNLIDIQTLRYASCFIPETSSELMVLLLDNVDQDAFESVDKDYLDVILGGHTSLRHYSVDAILEILKRSSRPDILHAIILKYDFTFFSSEELEHITRILVDELPSSLLHVDQSGSIPLHHACNMTSWKIVQLFIHGYLRIGTSKKWGLIVKNKKGVTPAQILVRRESNEFINIISDLFEDNVLDESDVEEMRLLHEALQHKREDMARFLLHKFPSEIGKMTEDGHLPIHIATAQNLDLDLIQLLISEGMSSVGKRCGGLCIWNAENIAPIQNIVKVYNDTEAAEFLALLLDFQIINEHDVLENKLLEIAIGRKGNNVVRALVKQIPKTLSTASGGEDESTPLHLACRQGLNHNVIRLMIDIGLPFYEEHQHGGLLMLDEIMTTPLHYMIRSNSEGTNCLLKYVFCSEKPLVLPHHVIKYNLDRAAICGGAPQKYKILYNCLSDELKKTSLESVDAHGRGNIYHALKGQHTNELLMELINEQVRLCQDSGLFNKDHFGDMPINILFRTHHPRWPESCTLVQQLINIEIITRAEISKFNLLHKIAQWPRCEHSREKARLLLAVFPEGLAKKDRDGKLPIHNVISMYKDWSGIKAMLQIFLSNGRNQGVKGVGGLLVQNAEGRTVLEECLQHEASDYEIHKDPRTIVDMMQVYANALRPDDDGMDVFFKTIMKLTPCKLLPELITVFGDSIACSSHEGKLLIHWSAERGLQWIHGLEQIYAANRPALLQQDPLNCYPMILASTGPNSDLNTIFEIMRKEVIPVVTVEASTN